MHILLTNGMARSLSSNTWLPCRQLDLGGGGGGFLLILNRRVAFDVVRYACLRGKNLGTGCSAACVS